ncbi:MAG: hypothetical protein M9928_16570 [Anaerolineae bacterium]|nr:hypothetical protein [Anaerolineae bacterium]MCO5206627.1 hypothetical protein [Anaerolineae bacterium]
MLRKIETQGTKPFKFVRFSAIQFIVLTIVAMFLYPGGTSADATTTGYSFTENFFSTLGLLTAENGDANTISAILFFIALTVAGLGLITFFVAMLPLFWERRLPRMLALIGAIFGVLAGISFIGVAFTPADLLLDAHVRFVFWAFEAFFVAVLFSMVAVLFTRRYPNRYAVVYGVFAVLLAIYIGLLFNGPGTDTVDGLRIQATGQKLIVYAAIIVTLIQAHGAIRLLEREAVATSGTVAVMSD